MNVVRKIQRLGFIVALLTACACGSSPNSRSEVFTEHRPVAGTTAQTPSRHLGEDCTANGYAICLSRLCGHFAASPSRGYFCSRTCETFQNCPRDWKCNQVFPTATRGSMCVPPSNWDGGVALLLDGGVE
jgi:hypothetical protein